MREYLKELISLNGPLKVADFMKQALFHPLYGYYTGPNIAPFGKQGDFITAPEISQVFGELIGAYLVSLWQTAYHKQEINLVEMGAGKGTLMADLLRFTLPLEDFAKQTRIHIIEISNKLKQMQREALASFPVSWWLDFSSFVDHNPSRPLFFIANELFDCFAIEQFVKTAKGWCERRVGVNLQGEFEFVLAPTLSKTARLIDQLAGPKAGPGAVFEYAPEAVALFREIAGSLKRLGGIALIIDYGYVTNPFSSSLQAVKNHQYYSVLAEPGQADITALVNFGYLKQLAGEYNLQSSLVSQKEFLEGLGINLRKRKLLEGKSKEEQQEISSSLERLIDPKQMGELFKCLIVWH